RQPREAILAGNADPGTNPHARAVLAEIRAKQEAARRRRAEQDRADREALRAYRDAVDALLALPDPGAAALATARDRVYGDTEAATGYPLLASLPGVMDEHKITTYAARIATETDPARAPTTATPSAPSSPPPNSPGASAPGSPAWPTPTPSPPASSGTCTPMGG